ncbi:hypothetical protein [Mycolicibacterium sp. HS_4_1]
MAELITRDEIVAALRKRMRVGAGLTVPYARKWSLGGCEPSHSLWTFPHDDISTMAAGLLQLDASITATNDAVLVGLADSMVWVAVNGHTRDAQRASDFLIGRQGESRAVHVGNAPEVALEIIRGLSAPPAPIPAPCEILQVGFPGIHASDPTYVGSWQWYIHGEARDDEYVRRAANATLNAIQAKESKDTG